LTSLGEPAEPFLIPARAINNRKFEIVVKRPVRQSLDMHMQVVHAVIRWNMEAKPVVVSTDII
jgi:hypothetical protein